MSRTENLLLLFFMTLLLASCTEKTTSTTCFTDEIYTPRYATGFRILGSKGGKSLILRVKNPWQGAKDEVRELLLLSKGEAVPEGFHGEVLLGKAQRIVAMSSSYIAMLQYIGSQASIVGVSGRRFITNAYVKSHKEILDVGYDGNIDYETLLGLQPDLVLLYGIQGSSAMEAKLKELNIPFCYIGDYQEEDPLGKAEWLVALGYITGNGDAARRAFEAIPSSYQRVRIEASKAKDQPTVMLNTPYRDTWFMPSTESYMVRLIHDAKGKYIFTENTGNASIAIDMEKAYMLASKADFWLNVGQTETLERLKQECPKFSDIAAIRGQRVYNNTLRATTGGGNDFWESSIVHPDLVLRDLVKIFHKGCFEDKPFVYYKQLK